MTKSTKALQAVLFLRWSILFLFASGVENSKRKQTTNRQTKFENEIVRFFLIVLNQLNLSI